MPSFAPGARSPGLFWIARVFLPGMPALWIVAVVIDYGALHQFLAARPGGTPMHTWTLKGLHLLERNQQVFIISLGESILLLGGLLVGRSWAPASSSPPPSAFC